MNKIPRSTGAFTGDILCLLSLSLCVAYVFSGISGHRATFDDDIGIQAFHQANIQFHPLVWAQNRFYLLYLYSVVLQMEGNNFDFGNLVWQCIYIASVYSCYTFLRFRMSPLIALIGSALYLGYSSKYEPLIWWSAGFYTVSWLSFFLIMILLESPLRAKAKSLLLTVCITTSLYIYEVMLLVAPLISLNLFFEIKRTEKNYNFPQAFSLAALPTLGCLIQALILLLSPHKIFFSTLVPPEMANANLLQKLTYGLWNSFDATVGERHLQLIHDSLISYAAYYFDSTSAIKTLFTLSLISLVSLMIKLSPKNNKDARWYIWFGLIVFFTSAWTSSLKNALLTPSRLTGLPAIGLTIALCATIQTLMNRDFKLLSKSKIQNVFGYALLVIVLTMAEIEMASLSDLLHQSQDMADVDRYIAKQIHQLQPTLPFEAKLFVISKPTLMEARRAWTIPGYGFRDNLYGEALLTRVYGMPLHSLSLMCHHYDSPNSKLHWSALQKAVAAHPKHNFLFAFDNDFIVHQYKRCSFSTVADSAELNFDSTNQTLKDSLDLAYW